MTQREFDTRMAQLRLAFERARTRFERLRLMREMDALRQRFQQEGGAA